MGYSLILMSRRSGRYQTVKRTKNVETLNALTPGGRCLRGKRVLLLPARSWSRDVLPLFSRRLSKYGCRRSCSQVSRSDGSILRQPWTVGRRIGDRERGGGLGPDRSYSMISSLSLAISWEFTLVILGTHGTFYVVSYLLLLHMQNVKVPDSNVLHDFFWHTSVL